MSVSHPSEALPTPEVSQDMSFPTLPPQSPLRSSPLPETPITPSKAGHTLSQQTPEPTPHKVKQAAIQSQTEQTESYYWPVSSRGEVVLRHKDYQRVGNILVRLDYADKEKALDSSRKWITDVAERAGVSSWGQSLEGIAVVKADVTANGDTNKANVLGVGLLRKKKRPAEGTNGVVNGSASGASDVNTLADGLVRKKIKVADSS